MREQVSEYLSQTRLKIRKLFIFFGGTINQTQIGNSVNYLASLPSYVTRTSKIYIVPLENVSSYIQPKYNYFNLQFFLKKTNLFSHQ